MSILDGLKSFLDTFPKEPEICGITPQDAAGMVMLDVAYSPVLDEQVTDLYRDIPQPTKMVKDGSRYCLTWPEAKDFRWIDIESAKVARARFLLMRGHYYKSFKSHSYPNQQKIIAWYFDGSMWRPQEGSALEKAMGLA